MEGGARSVENSCRLGGEWVGDSERGWDRSEGKRKREGGREQIAEEYEYFSPHYIPFTPLANSHPPIRSLPYAFGRCNSPRPCPRFILRIFLRIAQSASII